MSTCEISRRRFQQSQLNRLRTVRQAALRSSIQETSGAVQPVLEVVGIPRSGS